MTANQRAVTVTQVQGDALVGVLAAPADTGPAPGVLLLGGSEGGLHERDARVLAAEGFTVLALAYFGAPGRPSGLVDIPLEYFSRGLDALAAQPSAGDRFGVIGGSRGGEAALLVGSGDDRVGAVVSVVGSGVVTAGIDYSRGRLLQILTDPPTSWTRDGSALPQLPYVIGDELRDDVEQGNPVRLELAFPPVPTVAADLERVSIPVERINGAVLLISASNDASWPCREYSQVAADRLARAGHPHPWEHLVLDSGHLIAGPPGRPITSTRGPGPGVTFEMGGTPQATTAARQQAWHATVEFLRTHLQRHETR